MSNIVDFTNKKQEKVEAEEKEYGYVFEEDADEDENLVLTDLEATQVIDELLDARNSINKVLELLGGGETDGSEFFD